MLPSSLTPRLGATALASTLLIGLAACGGAGDLGNDIGNGIQCGLTNCKSSTEVAAQDLRLGGNLRREDGRVTADLGFGYRANLITVVRLDAPDALWLMPGNVRLTPTSDQGNTLAGQVLSSQDAWTLRLQHRGLTHDSTVSLPSAVQIRVAAPGSLRRSQGQFGSTLSGPVGQRPQLSLADGECQLADGRSVRWAGYHSGPQARLQASHADQAEYTVGLEDLQASLDLAAAAAAGSINTPVTVKQCRLGLVWEYSAKGAVAAGLSTYSLVNGISQARQLISYANDR